MPEQRARDWIDPRGKLVEQTVGLENIWTREVRPHHAPLADPLHFRCFRRALGWGIGVSTVLRVALDSCSTRRNGKPCGQTKYREVRAVRADGDCYKDDWTACIEGAA